MSASSEQRKLAAILFTDMVDKSHQDQESACWYLRVDPIYDSVRNEPRFQALVQKAFRQIQ
jgi:hypothetical protein